MTKLATAIRPTAPTQRIVLLDALRGFALLGVCLANAYAFSGWWLVEGEAQAALATPLDGAFEFAMHWLVDSKFYVLFSLLFGVGFALQLSKVAVGSPGYPEHAARYRRRLWWLLAFGTAHLLLLWHGDILMLYAALGFALLALWPRVSQWPVGKGDRRLLWWAAALIGVAIVQHSIGTALTQGYGEGAAAYVAPGLLFRDASSAVGEAIDAPSFAALYSDDHGEAARVRLTLALMHFAHYAWVGRVLKVSAIFLVGLWAGRRLATGTLLHDTARLRKVLLVGIAIGLPLHLAHALLYESANASPLFTWIELADFTVYAVGMLPLGLAYAAGFALLYQRATWQRVLDWFAPAGRMALTNYLTQTAVGVGLYYGIGLGLGPEAPPRMYLGLALLTFVMQRYVSAWWLSRRRYGPMEGLWRRLTYGKPSLVGQ